MIRAWLRKWLGIYDGVTYAHMNVNLAAKQSQIDALQSEVANFKSDLKAMLHRFSDIAHYEHSKEQARIMALEKWRDEFVTSLKAKAQQVPARKRDARGRFAK